MTLANAQLGPTGGAEVHPALRDPHAFVDTLLAGAATRWRGWTTSWSASADRSISLRPRSLRHDDLPQLDVARAERAGGAAQEIDPHPEEPVREDLRIGAANLLPVRLEPIPPRQQRRHVVAPEVVHVLDAEEAAGGDDDLIERGQLAVGKDVAHRKRVRGAFLVADRVQQPQPAILEHGVDDFHVEAEVAAAHRLEHADRGH